MFLNGGPIVSNVRGDLGKVKGVARRTMRRPEAWLALAWRVGLSSGGAPLGGTQKARVGPRAACPPRRRSGPERRTGPVAEKKETETTEN